MAKSKTKREILAPVTKGRVSHSVVADKVARIVRVNMTEFAPGDQVSVVAGAGRSVVHGQVISVSGDGAAKHIYVSVLENGIQQTKSFLVSQCQITRTGNAAKNRTKLGFLMNEYSRPGVNVGQVFVGPKQPVSKK